MSVEVRKKYDSNVASMELIYTFEEDGVVYFFNRFVTKKILMMKGRECIKAGAWKKLPDGSVIEVYRTYEDTNYENTGNFDRMIIRKGGAHYKPYKVGNKTFYDVSIYQDFYSGGNTKLKFIKGFMASYFKKIFCNQFTHIETYVNEEKRFWNSRLKKYPKF